MKHQCLAVLISLFFISSDFRCVSSLEEDAGVLEHGDQEDENDDHMSDYVEDEKVNSSAQNSEREIKRT